jgi:hypothetical protein
MPVLADELASIFDVINAFVRANDEDRSNMDLLIAQQNSAITAINALEVAGNPPPRVFTLSCLSEWAKSNKTFGEDEDPLIVLSCISEEISQALKNTFLILYKVQKVKNTETTKNMDTRREALEKELRNSVKAVEYRVRMPYYHSQETSSPPCQKWVRPRNGSKSFFKAATASPLDSH